jgi:phage terminase large subunit
MPTTRRTIDIETPRAFVPLLSPARFKGAHGGRGGAKSHFFGGRLIEECLSEHIRAACVREVQNSIKDSVKQLLEDKIRTFDVEHLFRVTDREITGPNDSLIIFRGLQNHTATSIKSLEGFNRCWVEEAQTISQRSLDLLTPTFRRGSELSFSWNPVFPTDPVDRLFRENADDPDFICVSVTYADNPWFPAELRREMERDRRRDPDKYAHVWGGGYIRNSEARVFRNWRVGSDEEFQPSENTRFYYGADWGFAQDPNVLLRSYIDGRTLYIDHEAYMIGCDIDFTPFLFGGVRDASLLRLNAQALVKLLQLRKCPIDAAPLLADKTKDDELTELAVKWLPDFPGVPDSRKWPIRADSARPETISYMQQHGFAKMQPAKKGAGSVEDGVEFLKSYDVVIHPRCTHAIDEFTMYSYRVDPLTGQVLPILEDKKNHVVDSARYALTDARAPIWKAY